MIAIADTNVATDTRRTITTTTVRMIIVIDNVITVVITTTDRHTRLKRISVHHLHQMLHVTDGVEFEVDQEVNNRYLLCPITNPPVLTHRLILINPVGMRSTIAKVVACPSLIFLDIVEIVVVVEKPAKVGDSTKLNGLLPVPNINTATWCF